MIQFNLLPDVKLQYIKTQRTKRTVITIAIISSIVALAIFAFLFVSVRVFQKIALDNASDDAKKLSSQLTGVEDLNKILTVQNQLSSVNSLHDQKVDAKRIPEFFNQLTPTQATISSLTVDYDAGTMNIIGQAPTLDIVNKFVDTLKFTTYQVDGGDEKPRAFNDVVLSTFGRSDEQATYVMTLSFAPEIFKKENKVTLVVPAVTTTRSVLNQSSDLFEESPEEQ